MSRLCLILVLLLAACSGYNPASSGPAPAAAPVVTTTRAAAMANQRRTILYSGHVQGVGFRAGVVMASRGYDVAGEVKNLPDGRVELTVEGSPATIDSLLERINEQFADYIRKTTQNTSAPLGLPAGIRIAY